MALCGRGTGLVCALGVRADRDEGGGGGCGSDGDNIVLVWVPVTSRVGAGPVQVVHDQPVLY